jgi:hypothetical protein
MLWLQYFAFLFLRNKKPRFNFSSKDLIMDAKLQTIAWYTGSAALLNLYVRASNHLIILYLCINSCFSAKHDEHKSGKAGEKWICLIEDKNWIQFLHVQGWNGGLKWIKNEQVILRNIQNFTLHKYCWIFFIKKFNKVNSKQFFNVSTSPLHPNSSPDLPTTEK